MTAPFEIEEPEPVPMSGLLRTRCRACRVAEALCAPGQEGNAKCGPCRLLEGPVRPPSKPLPPAYSLWAPRIGCEPPGSENGSEPIPPEMVCPVGCPHPVPGPVHDLGQVALRTGWMVGIRHSRGGVMGGAGKQLAVAELWSVRFRREGWAGYAVRRGAAWESVAVTGVALPPFLALGVTDLREWLADPEQPGGVPLTEWVSKISERVRDQALASKIVKCPGPGECAWVDERRGDHTHRANGEIKIKKSKGEPRAGL